MSSSFSDLPLGASTPKRSSGALPRPPSGTAPATKNSKSHQEIPRLPTSRSFTFSVSSLWKPTKNSVLQWINEVPGPVKREEPIEPTRYMGKKHGLDSDSEFSIEAHRDKRNRMTSALSHHPTVEPRRKCITKPGRSLVRRVSNAAKRVIGPRNHEHQQQQQQQQREQEQNQQPQQKQRPVSYGGSVRSTIGRNSMLSSPTSIAPDRPKLKFVVVGDRKCGKSSMLLRWYRDTFTLHYTATQYELFSKVVEIDGKDIEIEMWDTCGDFERHQLELLTYNAWDGVLLCFPLNGIMGLNDARTAWLRDIEKYCRDAPIILIGAKKDLRIRSHLIRIPSPDMDIRIPAAEGAMTARAIGAVAYMECSAMTGEGVDNVFELAIGIALDNRAAEAEAEKRRLFGDGSASTLRQMLCFA